MYVVIEDIISIFIRYIKWSKVYKSTGFTDKDGAAQFPVVSL